MQVNRAWGFVLIAVGAIGLAGYGNTQPTEGGGRTGDTGSIDGSVYAPYKRADWNDTFALYGAAAVAGPIQALRERTAQIAISDPECGRVLWSEFSSNRSHPTRLVAYADCESGKRFYVDDQGRVSTEMNEPIR